MYVRIFVSVMKFPGRCTNVSQVARNQARRKLLLCCNCGNTKLKTPKLLVFQNVLNPLLVLRWVSRTLNASICLWVLWVVSWNRKLSENHKSKPRNLRNQARRKLQLSCCYVLFPRACRWTRASVRTFACLSSTRARASSGQSRVPERSPPTQPL